MIKVIKAVISKCREITIREVRSFLKTEREENHDHSSHAYRHSYEFVQTKNISGPAAIVVFVEISRNNFLRKEIHVVYRQETGELKDYLIMRSDIGWSQSCGRGRCVTDLSLGTVTRKKNHIVLEYNVCEGGNYSREKYNVNL